MARSFTGQRILILGATGMVGKALVREARRRGGEVFGAARRGSDVVCNVTNVDDCFRVFEETRPQLAINAAAITNFDLCECEADLAASVNSRAPGLLACAAKRHGARFVQISTDHFFSSGGAHPHREDDPVTLVNNYARSKFAGEFSALAECSSLVLRTNVTGLEGLNGCQTFASWAFDVVNRRCQAVLFDDYFTSTLDVLTFSSLVFDLVGTDASGIVNLASRDVSSKREFVEALARAMGRPLDEITPKSVSSLTTPRAASCGLDVSRAEEMLGRRLPRLDEVLKNLISESKELGCPSIA